MVFSTESQARCVTEVAYYPFFCQRALFFSLGYFASDGFPTPLTISKFVTVSQPQTGSVVWPFPPLWDDLSPPPLSAPPEEPNQQQNPQPEEPREEQQAGGATEREAGDTAEREASEGQAGDATEGQDTQTETDGPDDNNVRCVYEDHTVGSDSHTTSCKTLVMYVSTSVSCSEDGGAWLRLKCFQAINHSKLVS